MSTQGWVSWFRSVFSCTFSEREQWGWHPHLSTAWTADAERWSSARKHHTLCFRPQHTWASTVGWCLKSEKNESVSVSAWSTYGNCDDETLQETRAKISDSSNTVSLCTYVEPLCKNMCGYDKELADYAAICIDAPSHGVKANKWKYNGGGATMGHSYLPPTANLSELHRRTNLSNWQSSSKDGLTSISAVWGEIPSLRLCVAHC